MKFGEIFKKSFNDYKSNFSTIFKANFWYGFFPYILVFALVLFMFFSSGMVNDIKEIANLTISYSGQNITLNDTNFESSPMAEEFSSLGAKIALKTVLIFGATFLLLIISFFLSLYAHLCNFMVRKGEKFSALRSRIKGLYWKFSGLIIIIVLIMLCMIFAFYIAAIPLFIILAYIPSLNFLVAIIMYFAILFLVLLLLAKLVLSIPVLLYENKRVFESIKMGWKLSKGNVFRILGYFVILALAGLVIYVVFYLIGILGFSLIGLDNLELLSLQNNPANVDMIFEAIKELAIFMSILYSIFYFVVYLIIIPFANLFVKNLYFELKGKKDN